MLNVVVEGSDKAGKSHLRALIAKQLKNCGCNVTVQSEETHNAGTMAMEEDLLLKRLRDEQIILKEMRTAI